MKKGTKKLLNLLDVVIGLLVAIAVGGLFATGTTLGYPILSYIPEVIHTIVGWVIIIGAIVKVAMSFIK